MPNKNFSINYPNNELTSRGKFTNDVVSLVAQSRIVFPYRDPEAVFLPYQRNDRGYEGFKAWAANGIFDPDTGLPIDRLTYLKKVLAAGGEVHNFPGKVKISIIDFDNQIVPNAIRNASGLTWKVWAKQNVAPSDGESQRFQSLEVGRANGFVTLRMSHYNYPTSTELKEYFSLLYCEVIDS